MNQEMLKEILTAWTEKEFDKIQEKWGDKFKAAVHWMHDVKISDKPIIAYYRRERFATNDRVKALKLIKLMGVGNNSRIDWAEYTGDFFDSKNHTRIGVLCDKNNWKIPVKG